MSSIPFQSNNLLLQSLSPQSFKKLEAKLTFIEHPRRTLIAEPGERFRYVYFPDQGMVSIVLVTFEGVPIEVGTVGKEGFVGIPILLGIDIADKKMYSQIAGRGWSISTEDFKDALNNIEELRTVCQRFTLTMLNQVSQTAACNRLHSLDERCARWLLLAHDRDPTGTIELTQEFLSMMLGVRRSGVNIAMKALENSGLVELKRGSIRVLDRKGLESASCACYEEVKQYFSRIMGKEFDDVIHTN